MVKKCLSFLFSAPSIHPSPNHPLLSSNSSHSYVCRPSVCHSRCAVPHWPLLPLVLPFFPLFRQHLVQHPIQQNAQILVSQIQKRIARWRRWTLPHRLLPPILSRVCNFINIIIGGICMPRMCQKLAAVRMALSQREWWL